MITYYLLVNIITFLVWGLDKFKAALNQWRVPEKTLTIIIFMGGGIGALCGMTIFRHKTRKPRFKVIATLSIAIHVIIFFFLLN